MANGYRLCSQCQAELYSTLRNLPSLYEECGFLLTSSRRPQEKTSGGPLPGMRLNDRAVEVRAAVLSGLASWAGLVSGERRLTAPSREVPTLATFLERHLDWLCRHSAADDFSHELTGIVRATRRLVSPAEPHRMAIGQCVEPGCTGTLIAVPDARGSDLRSICCDALSEHRWQEHEWLQLRERMRRPSGHGPTDPVESRPPRWLSPQAVSRLWDVPTGSIYRLASQHRWERRRKSGRTYYAESDVRRTLVHRGSRVPA